MAPSTLEPLARSAAETATDTWNDAWHRVGDAMLPNPDAERGA